MMTKEVGVDLIRMVVEMMTICTIRILSPTHYRTVHIADFVFSFYRVKNHAHVLFLFIPIMTMMMTFSRCHQLI